MKLDFCHQPEPAFRSRSIRFVKSPAFSRPRRGKEGISSSSQKLWFTLLYVELFVVQREGFGQERTRILKGKT